MPDTTTVIVGAGHCGLAMSRCLAARSIDHVVLERGEVANSWRTQRWDSLRLLTPNWMTRLPGYAYRGADPDGYLSARQVAAMLDGLRRRIRGAGTDRHDGDLGAGRRRRLRRARPTRAPGARRRWCWPAGRRRCPPCRRWRGRCRTGSPRSPRRATATRASCPRAACWWSAPRPAGSSSPTSCTAPGARSRSPSASTSGCRGPTAAGTSCGGWTPPGVLDERYDEVDDLVRARHAAVHAAGRLAGPDARPERLELGRGAAGRPAGRDRATGSPSSPAPCPTCARWPT